MMKLKMLAWAVIALAVGCSQRKDVIVQLGANGQPVRCWRVLSLAGVGVGDRDSTVQIGPMRITEPFAVVHVKEWTDANPFNLDATTCQLIDEEAER
jgi:hypothetical protein